MGFLKILSFRINDFMMQRTRSRALDHYVFHDGSFLEGNPSLGKKMDIWTDQKDEPPCIYKQTGS